jgi:hypothetical protein
VVTHSPPTYNPSGTVAEALLVYFDTYGLGDGGYDKPYHVIKLFGFLPVLLPNPPSRKRALRRHDLNHILGGFDAILTSGEIDIAGFEIGSQGGCGGYPVAWIINSFFFAFGVLSRPRHVFRAFVRSRGARNAYSLESVEGSFLDRKLGEVRVELNIRDRVPVPRAEDRLYFLLWAFLCAIPILTIGAILFRLSTFLIHLM